MQHRIQLDAGREQAERLDTSLALIVRAAIDAALQEQGYSDLMWITDGGGHTLQ